MNEQSIWLLSKWLLCKNFPLYVPNEYLSYSIKNTPELPSNSPVSKAKLFQDEDESFGHPGNYSGFKFDQEESDFIPAIGIDNYSGRANLFPWLSHVWLEHELLILIFEKGVSQKLKKKYST